MTAGETNALLKLVAAMIADAERPLRDRIKVLEGEVAALKAPATQPLRRLAAAFGFKGGAA